PLTPIAPRTFFFSNHPPTTHISTLSLHDALPIYRLQRHAAEQHPAPRRVHQAQEHAQPTRLAAAGAAGHADRLAVEHLQRRARQDRKSTRLNSSHLVISYAVFCLKKKKINKYNTV